MRPVKPLLALALCCALASFAAIAEDTPRAAPEIQACSEAAEPAALGIKALRAQGPAGLEALFKQYPKEVEELRARPSADAPLSPLAERVRYALDQVAQQKDAHSSGLYWYTSIEDARAASKTSGKPILALRMLGKLYEDCSCANSRFFRTALYANKEVSAYLKEHFTLVWTSERPVPKITIDFGDGRKLERTITGNSAHYILDAQGRVVDVLPGLYSPAMFMKLLKADEALALQTAPLEDKAVKAKLAQFHTAAALALQKEWLDALQELKKQPDGEKAALAYANPAAARAKADVSSGKKDAPTAEEAGPIAVSKVVVERPLLRAARGMRTLGQSTDDATWAQLAERVVPDAALDAGSIALIRSKFPTAEAAEARAESKAEVEDPLVSTVRAFQYSIALDTVRNEYLLHSQIHAWLGSTNLYQHLDQLNDRVYAELFLTPKSDPWLGLVPANTYTGLDREGLLVK